MKAAVLAVYSGLRGRKETPGSQARLTFFVSGEDFTSIRRKHSLQAERKSVGMQPCEAASIPAKGTASSPPGEKCGWTITAQRLRRLRLRTERSIFARLRSSSRVAEGVLLAHSGATARLPQSARSGSYADVEAVV